MLTVAQIAENVDKPFETGVDQLSLVLETFQGVSVAFDQHIQIDLILSSRNETKSHANASFAFTFVEASSAVVVGTDRRA